MTFPPAMSRVMPVIHEEASEARNSVALATSAGRPLSEREGGSEHVPLFGAQRVSHTVVLHRGGRDAIHSDPRGSELAGQVPTERDHATLGGGVGGVDCAGARAAAEDIAMIEPRPGRPCQAGTRESSGMPRLGRTRAPHASAQRFPERSPLAYRCRRRMRR